MKSRNHLMKLTGVLVVASAISSCGVSSNEATVASGTQTAGETAAGKNAAGKNAALSPDVLRASQHPQGLEFQVNLVGHNEPVTAVLKDGVAFIGDKVIGQQQGTQVISADKQVMLSLGSTGPVRPLGAGIINANGDKWPNGVIPYVFDGAATQATRDAFLGAKADYDAKTAIRFVPRTNEASYIRVITGDGCWSYVGTIGGAQDLSLGNGCSVNPARHELGHAVGLDHEQVRQDRDQWVTVNAGGAQNEIDYGAAGVPIGPYDFESMMHYRNYFVNGRWDYVPKNGFAPENVGNDRVNSFTQGDLAAIAAIYGKSGPGNPGTSNPGTGGTGISLTLGDWVSLQVTTPGYTNRYLRHSGSIGFTEVIGDGSSTLLKGDATFRIVGALDGTPCYSFESRNYAGKFLRHSGFRLRIDGNDGSDLMHRDATFCAQTGLSGTGVSLVSRNIANGYIRHRNGEVWVDGYSDNTTYRQDASWNLANPWLP